MTTQCPACGLGMTTAGTDLKAERIQANVMLKVLAARMGVSRVTVWSIERSGPVAHARAAHYRAALRVATA